MSSSSHNPRFGVVILPGGQATEQEHHCTQAILDRHGHTVAVFQFPDYQALFDAASAEQFDAVIYDSRAATERERTFMHLLGEDVASLWSLPASSGRAGDKRYLSSLPAVADTGTAHRL